MTSQPRLVATSLAALFGAGALLGASAVQAFDSIGIFWQEVYPNSQSDDNAMDQFGTFCGMCHERDDGGPKNGYAQAIATARANLGLPATEAGYKEAIVAVEPLNSDGDACDPPASNLTEINQNTQPGWAIGSTPPFTVTGLLDPEYCTGGPVVGPEITVVPTSIDYGTVFIGETATGFEVTIYNVGTEVLTVDGLTLTNPVFDFGEGNPPPAVPFDIAPGGSVFFGVTYSPVAEGVDTGQLIITSNDEDESTVTVDLTGIGVQITGACAATANPSSVDFGAVEIGDSSVVPVAVSNVGDQDCTVTVSVQPCQGEFFLDPISPSAFVLAPGDSVDVLPGFAPLDVGAEQCRMDVLVAEGDDVQVPLRGEGVLALADLDIQMFRATPQVRLSTGRPVSLRIAVYNVGTDDGVGYLTVVGQQDGVEVYRQTLTVSDAVGGGVTTYVLQSYFPTDTGTIEWVATLVSGNPTDTATASTLIY